MNTKKIKLSKSTHPAKFVVGLDVHKHQIALCIFGKDLSNAPFEKSTIFNSNPQGLAEMWNFISKYRPQGFVMEATGIYHHTVAQFLEEQKITTPWNYEIVIANPADASGLAGSQKNDYVDAARLAKLYWHGLLQSKTEFNTTIEDLKALFRVTAKLEQERTRLKNRIKKTLDQAGFRPRGLDLNLEWILRLILDFTNQKESFGNLLKTVLCNDSAYSYASLLRKHLQNYQSFDTIQLTSTQQLIIRQNLYDLELKTARKIAIKVEMEHRLLDTIILRNHAYNLSTIPGISPYSALWILAECGNPSRFSSVRQFLSYCGCAPRIAESAGKVYSAHISRRSNKFLRNIFYNAAIVVTNLTKSESDLKSFSTRTMKRKQGRPKVGTCIIAAKIARICFAILRDGVPFNPTRLNNQRLREDGRDQITLFERKDIKRAKRALIRIKPIIESNQMEPILDDLVQKLETLL